MGDVPLFLLTIAGIFLVGIAGELVFRRTGVPDVVWLIAVGVVLGPISGVVDRAQLGAVAPYFAALTLIVVLFEGGSRLQLTELRRAAPRSAALALATFALSSITILGASQLAALAGLLPADWTWKHGLLLGTILGGSSAVIIMPTMARANVAPPLANLLGLESAVTDVLCVVGATTLIGLLGASSSPGSSPTAELMTSFGVGAGLGVVSGLAWLMLLRVIASSEHGYPLTLAGLLLLYVLVESAGGSAALAVLAFAVVIGNAGTLSPRLGFASPVDLSSDVRGFHSQVVFMIKSFFFTFIGLMLSPPWSLLLLGGLFGVLLFAARVPGTYLALARSGFDGGAKKLAAVAMPRGMAAGVLSTLPAHAGVPGTELLPVLVFACVVMSILLFAGGLLTVQRRAKRAAVVPAVVPLPAASEPAAAAPADEASSVKEAV